MLTTTSAPDNPPRRHTVDLGGITKAELRAKLQTAGVQLNAYAIALFDDDRFTVSEIPVSVEVEEVTVASLGLIVGATYDRIVEEAFRRGYALCHRDLGPQLRLQYRDQPEGLIGSPPTKHCAPPGSITIASEPLAHDEVTPRGFYLRKMDGVLWLRGYCCADSHIWSPDDVLVFARETVLLMDPLPPFVP